MRAYGILLCGGSGVRMGLKRNKTSVEVGGVPACVRAARALRSCTDGLIAVVRRQDMEEFSALFSGWQIPLTALVPGGDSRQASVREGLNALPPDAEYVLIHYGARALLDKDTAQRVLMGAVEHGAAAAAVPLSDTLKRADETGRVLSTIPREGLYRMQTPQGFQVPLIIKAHEAARDILTDDAALVEQLGIPVWLVPGNTRNLKLTTQEDWAMADRLSVNGLRVGTGYDAHRLTEGRRLILCGVDIPWEKGLLGHSDADVALHALMDALLGAAALGDIGAHFPDTDPAYKGISSLLLLKQTALILRDKSFAPVNTDITIVAQAPKLAPWLPLMRENIAQALGLPVARVSVKATTTERMGYEGRGEGISAQASALIAEIDIEN